MWRRKTIYLLFSRTMHRSINQIIKYILSSIAISYQKKLQILLHPLPFSLFHNFYQYKIVPFFTKIWCWSCWNTLNKNDLFLMINCVIFSFASYHINSNISCSKLECYYLNTLKNYNLYRTYLIDLPKQCGSSPLLFVNQLEFLLKPI